MTVLRKIFPLMGLGQWQLVQMDSTWQLVIARETSISLIYTLLDIFSFRFIFSFSCIYLQNNRGSYQDILSPLLFSSSLFNRIIFFLTSTLLYVLSTCRMLIVQKFLP